MVTLSIRKIFVVLNYLGCTLEVLPKQLWNTFDKVLKIEPSLTFTRQQLIDFHMFHLANIGLNIE